MQTATPEQFEALQDIAQNTDGTLRSYSGRCMYGERCLAISADSEIHVLEEAGSKGIRGAKVDNLGRGFIVYWPKIGVPAYFNEHEDEEE